VKKTEDKTGMYRMVRDAFAEWHDRSFFFSLKKVWDKTWLRRNARFSGPARSGGPVTSHKHTHQTACTVEFRCLQATLSGFNFIFFCFFLPVCLCVFFDSLTLMKLDPRVPLVVKSGMEMWCPFHSTDGATINTEMWCPFYPIDGTTVDAEMFLVPSSFVSS